MGLKIYTGGTFDLLHKGHVEFLKRCSEFGSVTVALNTDEFIKEYKGQAPVMTYEERKAVLEACRFVDKVIPNRGGANSKPSIMAVMPDMIIIGSDWAVRDYHKQMGFTQSWLDERSIMLCYIPYTQGISSTDIKKRLLLVK
jgi:glycerol-3-phosphate cytidylyltransferase